MSNFILISFNNRLHGLVDSICDNCLLYHAANTHISAGKLIQKDNGSYEYEYTMAGEVYKSEGEKALNELLANQLASFRKAYHLNENSLPVFCLDNPTDEEELKQSEFWIQEIEKVYGAGKGSDTGFCIYRVFFSYNWDKPADVNFHLPVSLLTEVFEYQKSSIQDTSRCPSCLLYIDNQDLNGAAICLSKEEHNFKMPRFLLDFMMLVSSSNSSYNISGAINASDFKCFSIGYAESMYYYNDVERYFALADRRDIYRYILECVDERENSDDKQTMDIEHYPRGLRRRLDRLSKIYDEIPWKNSLDNYAESADLMIDNLLSSIKDVLKAEREIERQIFEKENSVETLHEESRDILLTEDDQKGELAFDEEKNISSKKLDNFLPKTPEYIDRKMIYDELLLTTEKKREEKTEKLSKDYRSLINYIRSDEFLESVKEHAPYSKNAADEKQSQLAQNPGCLSRLLFWKKKPVVEDAVEKMVEISNDDVRKVVSEINTWIDLKAEFNRFKHKVKEVEDEYSNLCKECNKFKLTDHSNNYCLLIDLGKMIKEQTRLNQLLTDNCLREWESEGTGRTWSGLLDIVVNRSKEQVKKNFFSLSWLNLFGFIVDKAGSPMGIADICNKLQDISVPMVNYNNITATLQDNIIKYYYSNRSKFHEEFSTFKENLINGDKLMGCESSHITSKICMFQFLPMNKDIIEDMVDMQKSDD